MLKRTRWGIGLTTGAAVLAVVLGATGVLGRARAVVVPQQDPGSAWAKRIALVDDAIGQTDLNRATYEWHEAYGAAVRSGGAEGLIAVGDRAMRLAQLSHVSGYFVTEARYIYMHAAL